MKRVLLTVTLPWIIHSFGMAQETRVSSSPPPAGQNQTEAKNNTIPRGTFPLGVSYFTFFDGPGLMPGMYEITPNVLGKPNDDGLRLSNYVSLKYKVSSRFAADFQMRIQWILNNANDVDQFQSLRWQSPRIGISGKLLSGKDWTLTGAVNTDFPYFVPRPLGGGVVARQRTTIFNPGLFAKFSYEPKLSRWSVVSLVMPRFFLYEDRSAAEPQLSRAGFSPELKNEFLIDLAPTLNYALGHKTGLRLGTELIYSKFILSNWNPFHGSLNVSDIHSKAWRLAPVPIQLGVTHEWSEIFSISLFLQGYPLAAQRVRRDGSSSSFLNTTSVGMWISGTVI